MAKKPKRPKSLASLMVLWFCGVMFLPAFLYAALSIIFPNSNSQLLVYISLVFIFITMTIWFIKGNRLRKNTNQASKWISAAHAHAELAQDCDYLPLFLESYGKAIAAMEKVVSYEGKVNFTDSPSYDLMMLKHNKQWRIRDAMEKHCDTILKEAKGIYRNNRQQTQRDCEAFVECIEKNRIYFDKETIEFADSLIHKLPYRAENSNSSVAATGSLSDIDYMEGHEFEYWCADLLRKNGFINVEVTPGSGDQGVDILAEKDDIRYAIQCKCYTSDLGNTPVQEVYTGKAVYNCQVGAVMTNRYFTAGAKNAAAATGVLLWDRDKLASMLRSE